MKLFPPNGIFGRLHMMQQSSSMLSHAALLMAGSLFQTIALAFQIRSKQGEWGWMELCNSTLSSVTGMPNMWCAVHPHSYAVAANVLLPTMSTICSCAHRIDESVLTKNILLRPGRPSMKSSCVCLLPCSLIWCWVFATAHHSIGRACCCLVLQMPSGCCIDSFLHCRLWWIILQAKEAQSLQGVIQTKRADRQWFAEKNCDRQSDHGAFEYDQYSVLLEILSIGA